MIQDFDTKNKFNRVIIIAKFKNSSSAEEACFAIEDVFDEIQDLVEEMFEKQNGQAEASDIAKIYIKHGLKNNNGWEHDLPLIVNGLEVAWALPAGADIEDVKNMFWSNGAIAINAHLQASNIEEWQLAPHPISFIMHDDDENNDDSDAASNDDIFLINNDNKTIATRTNRKRTVH